MSDGNVSDGELDRQWTPNGRPQSTMARSFSLALNDLFKIDNSIADLDAAVSEKKRAVSSQESELHALEARLRATEERLKSRQAASSPGGRSSTGRSSPRQRVPLGDTFTQAPATSGDSAAAGSGSNMPAQTAGTTYNAGRVPEAGLRRKALNQVPIRPGSGYKQEGQSSYSAPPLPGALPPTPGSSEGEFVLVESDGTSADYVIVDKDEGVPPPVPSKSNDSESDED